MTTLQVNINNLSQASIVVLPLTRLITSPDCFHNPIIHLVYPPKCLHKHFFQFLLELTIVPSEVKTILLRIIIFILGGGGGGKQVALRER